MLLTGGSSGIGKSAARQLLSHGACVTLVARNADRLASTARELQLPDDVNAATRRINTYAADCSKEDDVEAMTDYVEKEFGPVDILILCAGSSTGGYFEDLPSNAFRDQMDSNYFSAVFPAHAFFKRMCKRKAGHIVFVSSMAGLTAVFGQSAYCPTKYAVRGLAETLYFEGKPYGIDISIVFPPDTDTPGFRADNQTTPPETLKIQESGGLFMSDPVAKGILNGIKAKKFRVTTGLIGYLLGVLTTGLTPQVSLDQVLLIPITRAVTPFFLWDQNSIIRKGHHKRFPQPPDNEQSKSTSQTSSHLQEE